MARHVITITDRHVNPSNCIVTALCHCIGRLLFTSLNICGRSSMYYDAYSRQDLELEKNQPKEVLKERKSYLKEHLTTLTLINC